jgi:hypothetical protein
MQTLEEDTADTIPAPKPTCEVNGSACSNLATCLRGEFYACADCCTCSDGQCCPLELIP